MAVFSHIDALLRGISYLGFIAAGALLLLVGVLGAADVVTTNVFMQPISGMVELSGSLLAVIVFLGLAEAQARGANIVIDIATTKMGPVARRLCAIVSLSIGAIFLTLVAWQATKLAGASWSYNERALGAFEFPLAPFKTLACFGAWLAAAEFVRQLIRQIAGVDAGAERVIDHD